jgi:Flp pilus assembly protein TadD
MVIGMVKRGCQQSVGGGGIRDAGPTWGRRQAVRRGLVALALLGALALVGIGCTTTGSGNGQAEGSTDAFFANMRTGSGELSRVMQNVRYYKLMGQPALALKELELAHRQDPDNLEIVDALAHNYEELGKFEAARKLYQEALTRHGPQPALANNLCFSYYLQGRWAEAETCFRKTLAQDPQNVAARNNLGLLYCRLGRVQEARRLWQEAEGEAAADRKVSEALAALGMKARKAFAQAPKPPPSARPKVAAPPPVVTPKQKRVVAMPPPVKAEAVPPATKLAVKPPAPEAPKMAKVAPRQAVVPAPSPVVTPKPEHIVAKPEPVKAEAPPPAIKPAVKPPAPEAPKMAKAAPIKAVVPAPPPVVTPKPEHIVTKPAPVKAEAPPPAIKPAEKPPAPEALKVAKAAPTKVPETHRVRPPASPAPHQAPIYLTTAERLDNPIEVRNGTWTRNLAHQVRSLLNLEGFTVAIIGNHIDFGAKKTIIYYRPGAARVAQALKANIFRTASLEETSRLKDKVAVKILLGADLLKQADMMARLGEGEAQPLPAAKQPPAPAKLRAAPVPAQRPAPAKQESQAVPAKKATPPAHPLPPKPLAPVTRKLPTPEPLTAAELIGTPIEVRNGTWTRNLAHEVRSLLNLEGFTVAVIGNHIDFGAKKTIIYYRPGTEKVARALASKFFPMATLESSEKLNKDMGVKILLGADLLQYPNLMARLAGEGEQ